MVNCSKAKSFTLVEILVVTALIILLSGTSLAIFSSFRDEKTLDNQATLFKSVIELAIEKAAAGDVSLCSSPETAHVAGYSVIVDSENHNLTLMPECDTVPTPIKYAIPSNIIYVNAPFSLRFDYQNYQGETRKFSIKNKTTEKCKYVQIDETGIITSGDDTLCL